MDTGSTEMEAESSAAGEGEQDLSGKLPALNVSTQKKKRGFG